VLGVVSVESVCGECLWRVFLWRVSVVFFVCWVCVGCVCVLGVVSVESVCGECLWRVSVVFCVCWLCVGCV
jgi:hypothetical protein